ncbi:polysaccharide deacetylase family protein [Halomonas sp. PR-M31]|uniref:polysaccharide deacetylase family protein n=1 Tax=Halomonas sp. PR-M31 TaxID=1471202 RepID=UPI000652189D|nr:polysaccharide deacetylase family protein [Halomonas sp. PR-M31]
MNSEKGTFVISLDFELYWGVRDKKGINDYRENILGVWKAIPAILDLLEKYNVHATWATVGILFAENKQQALLYSPTKKPSYTDKNLSPYLYLEENGFLEDEMHFAPDLIKKISRYAGQEVATHTYCHYYCLEDGQSDEEFKEDISSAIKIASQYNIETKSLVFPRNQFNENYLNLLSDLGITSYRGTEKSWIYKADHNKESKKRSRRAARLLDSYINLSGHNTYKIEKNDDKASPIDIRSSRFLRPVSEKLKFLESIRLQRIKRSMKNAAKKGEIYHLWFHPHNFGVNLHENIEFLESILKYYSNLNSSYDMNSLNMSELCEKSKGNSYGKKAS